MAGDDVLIVVETTAATAPVRSLPVQITKNSFVSADAPFVPGGHAIAREAGCFKGTCLLITVDFATRPPSDRVLDRANAVLRSLKVDEP
jgi:hypothetical protein